MAKEWKPTIEESGRVRGSVRRRRRADPDAESSSLTAKQIGIALVSGLLLGLIGAVIPWERIGFDREEAAPLSRQAGSRLLALRNMQRLGSGGMPVESDASVARRLEAARAQHGAHENDVINISDMGMVVAAEPEDSYPPRP